MEQHPLFPLLLSLIGVLLVVQESLQKGKFLRIKFLTNVFNLFLLALCWLLYDKFILPHSVLKWLYFSYCIFVYVWVGALLLLLFRFTQQKVQDSSNFVEALKHTQWNVYYSTDKKDRIKIISAGLLHELGLSKEEVIGKKAFDVFDKTIRFTKSNGVTVTNQALREFYKEFKSKTKEHDEIKREVFLLNYKGDQVILNLIERPIYMSGKYRGRLCIGQKKSDLALLTVEKDLIDRNNELESIQHKFIAALEITSEGIYFHHLDQKYIWGNDIWVQELKLGSNTISSSEYFNMIHPDDRALYQDCLQSISPQNPAYSMKYRVKVGLGYQIIRETGKRIYEDESSQMILGYAKIARSSYFERTDYVELDSLKGQEELMVHLHSLFDQKRVFELVCIQMTNLVDINEEHGRGVGNLVLNEYVKLIKNNFITESSAMFRTSGLLFFFTITDGRKMELFQRGLVQDAHSMNLRMEYGAIKTVLEVHMGIVQSNSDGANPEELVSNVKKALKTSLNENYRLNYTYYRDLK